MIKNILPHREALFGVTAFWRTLRFRFAAWISLMLFIVLIGFSLFVYRSLERSLANTLDDTLRVNALQAANLIDWEAASFQNTPRLPNHTVTLRFFDRENNRVYGTGSYHDIITPSEFFTSALAGQEGYATITDPFDTEDKVRLFTAPVRRDGAIVGTVQTVQSLDGVSDPLERLSIVLFIGIPIFVLIAGVGGYWLAGRALAPINRITATAAGISTADLATRLDLAPTHDEVGRLASTFNTMLARLEAAFQREQQFTADASHELRTPLATMRTISEMTLNRPRAAADYQTALTDMHEEVLRMQHLVEDLLALARQDSYQLNAREPLNLADLLQEVVESVRPLAEARDLHLTCMVEKNLIVLGNPSTLARLFVNLLDNAIKYTPRGEIAVTATCPDARWVKVAIRDTGIGIAQKHLPHLFERFYRADPARTSGGAGLGLTIAQTIAHAHQGKIILESVEQVGTTCWVSFPLHS